MVQESKPLVSVIIHSYNRFEYLLNALDSVHNQTYNNFEIILLNDDSDEEEYYTYNFSNKIKKIDIERKNYPDWPGSRQALINIGSENANGKFLAFLDDDDIWLPNKLEIQIKKMIENNYIFSSTEGFFGNGVYDINKNYPLYNQEHFFKILKKKYKKTNYLKSGQFPEVWDYNFLNIHNCIIKSSVIVEKAIFDQIGGIRGLPKNADYDCWLSLLNSTNLLYVDTPLFYYDGAHGSGKNYS